jgi:DNA polymerase III subunit beta
MRITVLKKDILDVLSKIQGLTGRKSNLAITSNILARANSSGLTISATDLETGFEGTYPASVEEEGVITISSRKFFEIIRDFPTDEIILHEVENRWIQIGNQNIEYHIVGMNPDDFPSIPQLEDVQLFDMESDALRKMIEKTTIVGASDDKRAHITGVFFEKIGQDDPEGVNAVRMVSTDGSRLSKVDYVVEKDVDLGEGIIIPKKGLIEVAKFLEAQGTAQVGYKENHFVVKKDSETIIIRLLEGEFPEYKGIIEKGETNIIPMDRQLFMRMLKRMSILSSDSYKGVIFNISDGKLIISSTNPDIGESKEDMVIDYKGDVIEVAFNPRYFIETLNVMEDEKIELNIVNDEKPCLIEEMKEKQYLSVIMPMRL